MAQDIKKLIGVTKIAVNELLTPYDNNPASHQSFVLQRNVKKA